MVKSLNTYMIHKVVNNQYKEGVKNNTVLFSVCLVLLHWLPGMSVVSGV